jgi:hypothetical protein
MVFCSGADGPELLVAERASRLGVAIAIVFVAVAWVVVGRYARTPQTHPVTAASDRVVGSGT